MTLFRKQALAARQTKSLGDIVLMRPLSFTFLTTFAAILAALICAFLARESYTKHITVSG
jgi:membrane fusion protein